MTYFCECFLEKSYVRQNISFQKRMLPLGDFLPPRKRLAPKIIGKQIFEFLISKSIHTRLINKRGISKNTDIWVRLKILKI
jgi:hypothetical protein